MNKILLLLLLSITASCTYAQTNRSTLEEQHLLDSMFKHDEFIKLIKKEKNYVEVSVGIGNGLFSTSNNAANATGINKQLVHSPAVMYRLKNGLNFGLSGFFTEDDLGQVALYQAGLNVGYDYYGDKITTGFLGTRYLSNQNKYNSKSQYQNDFYGYLKRAKGIIQPVVAIGFSNGVYKETAFTSFKRVIHLSNPPPNGRDSLIIISGQDSTNNKANYFSFSVNIEHDFTFYKVFSKNDELNIVPSLIVNAGSDKLTQTHTNQIYNRPAFNARKKSDFSNKFQIQSIAASLDVVYMIGKFFVQPNLYLDYYIPKTTEKKLNVIFGIAVGVYL